MTTVISAQQIIACQLSTRRKKVEIQQWTTKQQTQKLSSIFSNYNTILHFNPSYKVRQNLLQSKDSSVPSVVVYVYTIAEPALNFIPSNFTALHYHSSSWLSNVMMLPKLGNGYLQCLESCTTTHPSEEAIWVNVEIPWSNNDQSLVSSNLALKYLKAWTTLSWIPGSATALNGFACQ